ncbi:expressed protein [Echinococcus multilocularis]|uniref:Expressed protein n=1 Tax=Echinococcus multilocularis TaxID=6211 RepID=A0A087W036_ECHMU|nr:expressed protein [Echinococcus multilocularis]
MAKVGWDFGEDFATGPAVVPMSSGWPTTSSQAMPSSEGPVRIGFAFDEVAGFPTPLVSPAETPAGNYMNNNGSMNPDLLNSDDAIAYWTSSSDASRHTPHTRHYSTTPRFSGTQESTLSEGSKSSSSRQNSTAYEQGLAEMADLMTTVDLSEADKERIRERFTLDK